MWRATKNSNLSSCHCQWWNNQFMILYNYVNQSTTMCFLTYQTNIRSLGLGSNSTGIINFDEESMWHNVPRWIDSCSTYYLVLPLLDSHWRSTPVVLKRYWRRLGIGQTLPSSIGKQDPSGWDWSHSLATNIASNWKTWTIVCLFLEQWRSITHWSEITRLFITYPSV